MSSENVGKKDKEKGFFRSLSTRFVKDSKPARSAHVADDPIPMQVETRDVDVQTEFGHRTVAVVTDAVETRTTSTCTDDVGRIDREVATDRTGMWEKGVMWAPFMKDQGIDIGEWNMTLYRGVEAQTDAPDTLDPLFWCTGSFLEIRKLLTSLLLRVREEYLDTSEDFTPTELQADNILLRLEVEELKSRLKRSTLEVENSRYRANRIPNIVPSPFPRTPRYTVVSDGGVLVTSSLAPSSFVLGKVRLGDRILASGSPEEIMNLVRVPVLPRGWITVSDGGRTLLEVVKSGN
jgi:hypothetical protein